MNYWRSSGKARSIFLAFVSAKDDTFVKDYCMRLPPLCLAGRWQAIDRAEEYMMKPLLASPPGTNKVQAALLDVLDPKKDCLPILDAERIEKEVVVKDTDLVTEGICVEDEAAHKRRWGRWRKELFVMIRNYQFWLMCVAKNEGTVESCSESSQAAE